MLSKKREEAITLRAYGWRFGVGNSGQVRQAADDIYDLLAALDEQDAVIAQLVGVLKEAEGYVPLAEALDVNEEEWECIFCRMGAATVGAIHHTSACLITRIDAALTGSPLGSTRGTDATSAQPGGDSEGERQ